MSAWVIIADGIVEGVGVSVPGLRVLRVWYNGVRLGHLVKISVKITLLFRRAFKELMDQKGWDVPDIVMEEEEMVVP